MAKKRLINKKIPLYIQIMLGMVSGIIIGSIAWSFDAGGVVTDWIRPWGRLFIRLLQLIAVPLVFVSI